MATYIYEAVPDSPNKVVRRKTQSSKLILYGISPQQECIRRFRVTRHQSAVAVEPDAYL
jgi:hypothetical protein